MQQSKQSLLTNGPETGAVRGLANHTPGHYRETRAAPRVPFADCSTRLFESKRDLMRYAGELMARNGHS
jgi:hypothetical protein